MMGPKAHDCLFKQDNLQQSTSLKWRRIEVLALCHVICWDSCICCCVLLTWPASEGCP